MTGVVVAVVVLVAVLYALIASMLAGDHYAPQAYHRRKRGGAPLAGGYDAMAPRRRRRGPLELEVTVAQDLGNAPRERSAAARLT